MPGREPIGFRNGGRFNWVPEFLQTLFKTRPERREDKAAAVARILERRHIIDPTEAELQDAVEKYERDATRPIAYDAKPVSIQDTTDAVVFDFDGVLYNSVHPMVEADIRVIKQTTGKNEQCGPNIIF